MTWTPHPHPELAFAESHAAAIKNTVITNEKTMGTVKAYLQLKTVIATKQMASAHEMLRTRAAVSAGSPLSSHARYCREQKKHGEKKSERAEEVPISPGKPLRVKVDGVHQPQNPVRSPFRIVLAKPKRMSGGK